ncbi:hypothetical protein ACVD4U_004242 [Vibrio vulnificus]
MSKLKSAWNQTSNIVAWLGIALAGYHFYIQEIDKTHDMSIVVTSIDASDQEVIIGVLYRNSGDFRETVTNASISMTKSEVSNLHWSSMVKKCFSPITIESKDILHAYYKVPLSEYYAQDSYLLDGKITHDLNFTVEYLMPSNAVVSERFMFGKVTHIVDENKIKSYEVTNNSYQLKFSSKQNHAISKVVRPSVSDNDVLSCEGSV